MLLFLLCAINLNVSEIKTIEQSIKITMQENIIDLVEKNDIEGVKRILGNGVNVNTRDKNKRSLLLIATVNQQVEMAKLLVVHGADVNQQDDKMDSPFLYAGASGQTELIKLFLAHGARFDIFNRYNGTALIPACERGHVETVKVLVQTKGFPINHVNRLGWTALLEAVILGNGGKKHQEIIQILKDGGADLNIADHDGITALQHAKSRGFEKIVKILES